MRIKSIGMLAMMGLLSAAGLAMADEHYVATNGAPSGTYNSWETAATNIQDAINAASIGETIWVSNGVYTLGSQIEINKNITLRGFKGRDETIIDGAHATRCIYVAGNTPNCTVDGFTLRNGYVTAYPGGGAVELYPPCGATFSNCIITANESTNFGGGAVYGFGTTTGTFVNCVISHNTTSGSGGGLYMDQGCLSNCYIIKNYAGGTVGGGIFMGTDGSTNATIVSCVITGNYVVGNLAGGLDCYGTRVLNSLIAWNTSAFQIGGARIMKNSYMGNCVINSNSALTGDAALSVYANQTVENCEIRGNYAFAQSAVETASNCVLRGCLIADNVSSSYQGAVYFTAGYCLAQNCTIVSNRNLMPSPYSAGIYVRSDCRMENTICYSNMDPTASSTRNYYPTVGCVITYCCTTPDASAYGAGNTANEPQFVDFPNSNFRLTRTSPCINTGSNQPWMDTALDLDGGMRRDRLSGKVDMGAYEFIFKGTMFTVR